MRAAKPSSASQPFYFSFFFLFCVMEPQMCASAGWKWLQTREVNSHLLQMVGGANCGATKSDLTPLIESRVFPCC